MNYRDHSPLFDKIQITLVIVFVICITAMIVIEFYL